MIYRVVISIVLVVLMALAVITSPTEEASTVPSAAPASGNPTNFNL